MTTADINKNAIERNSLNWKFNVSVVLFVRHTFKKI